MKKKVMTLALMCCLTMSSKAQVYAYDSYTRLPTMDLYDTGTINMSVRALAETAAMRRQVVEFYGKQAIDAYHAKKWSEVITNANVAIKYGPYGIFYYIRGKAYEELGNYKQAKADYKRGKKDDYAEAAIALDELKTKMKQMRKK